MKVCKVCAIEKPLEDYYVNNGFYTLQCKKCYAKIQNDRIRPRRHLTRNSYSFCKNITKSFNKYVVKVCVNGIKKYKTFDNPEEAIKFRDEALSTKESKNKFIATVIEYYNETFDTKVTALKFNISQQTVSRYINLYLPYKVLEAITITKQSKV